MLIRYPAGYGPNGAAGTADAGALIRHNARAGWSIDT